MTNRPNLSGIDDPGPLTARVLAYEHALKRLVPTVQAPGDWEPLAAYIETDGFQRVGTFLEVQDWTQYAQMLTGWAKATTKFETTLQRVSEMPGLVYYEIEERHFHGDAVNTVNSMTVFAFNEDAKITLLNVYLQQPR